MWKLIHLPSSEIIYKNNIKGFVEIVFESSYFYFDLNTNRIEIKGQELSTTDCLKQKLTFARRISNNSDSFEIDSTEYQLIKLNKCEFDIVEVT